MKNIILLTVFLSFGLSYGNAQSTERIRVKAEEDVAEGIESRSQFRFKDFKEGKVYFKNGNSSTAPLNYNLLYDAVFFIDKKGDTLSLANPVQVKNIEIGGTLFYFDNGYYEVVSDFPPVKLALKQKLKESNRENVGGYGQNTNTAAINNLESMYQNSQSYNLKTNENVIYSRRTIYYFLDQNNRFLPAKKRNITKLFPKKHKNTIVDFIKENDTDFDNEESLNALLQFCSQLI